METLLFDHHFNFRVVYYLVQQWRTSRELLRILFGYLSCVWPLSMCRLVKPFCRTLIDPQTHLMFHWRHQKVQPNVLIHFKWNSRTLNEVWKRLPNTKKKNSTKSVHVHEKKIRIWRWPAKVVLAVSVTYIKCKLKLNHKQLERRFWNETFLGWVTKISLFTRFAIMMTEPAPFILHTLLTWQTKVLLSIVQAFF